MPDPDRVYAASPVAPTARADAEVVRAAVSVLVEPELAHVVQLVAWREDDHVYAASSEGACRFPLTDPTAVFHLTGRNPLARQDPLAFTPLELELAVRRLGHRTQVYPFAGERLAGLFADDDRSPDLAVVHTDAHHWPESGGHLGEHGSLGLFQSRAPFVLSGAGVTQRGVLDDATRTVDVAATLAWLAGVDDLAALDGRPRTDLVRRRAHHVVGLLWDGAHCSDLLERGLSGELPGVQRLLAHGVALRGGAIAEFPSVTLVNHTSALTGVGPGRHGIVNNAFWDRAAGEQVLANDQSTWHRACDLLRPGVQTVWELVADARPGAATACVNEPVDRGAAYSTMALIRAAGHRDGARSMGDQLPDPRQDPFATRAFVEADAGYAWSTQVDALGLQQLLQLWSGGEPPALTWCNTTLTDSAHHAGGPHSDIARAGLLDSDRRLSAWLDLVEERGLLDDTVVLLTADHGMVSADPSCTGAWGDALTEAGLSFRDEGSGFLYLA